MYCFVNTNEKLAKLSSLVESIEYRVNLLFKEQKAIADDHLQLILVASLSHRHLQHRAKTKDKRDILGNVALFLH